MTRWFGMRYGLAIALALVIGCKATPIDQSTTGTDAAGANQDVPNDTRQFGDAPVSGTQDTAPSTGAQDDATPPTGTPADAIQPVLVADTAAAVPDASAGDRTPTSAPDATSPSDVAPGVVPDAPAAEHPTVAISAIAAAPQSVVAGTITLFNATVTGSTNAGITWSATAGNINASTGQWTAPSVSTPTQVTITAVANADASQKSSTVVTVNPDTDPVASVVLSAATTNTYANDLVELKATVKTASGAPAPDGTAVSFTASLGTLKPANPVLTNQGLALVTLLAPSPGSSTVTASAAGITSTAVTITYTAAPVGYVTGEQRIAILLISFPSVPLLSQATLDLYRNAYFGPKPSVDSYLREVSYGAAWANGQVFGPYTLDADYFNQPQSARDAALRAVGSTVDLSKYNRLVLVVPQSSAGLESGGLGSIGTETLKLYPSGSMTASTTWLGDASAGNAQDLLNAGCHELGHNLGLEHARAADFGDEPLGPPGQRPAPFDQTRGYGDSFSNMARGLGHWAAPHKAALGWLRTGTTLEQVESDGTFVLSPYETADHGLKALRIRRGTGNDAWLWVEFRQPVAGSGSVDEGLPVTAYGGALLHYEDTAWKDTQAYTNLVRMNPDSNREIFFGNAPLAAGASFVDPYSNLTISLDKDLSKGLSVQVSYAPAPANPSAITPSTSQVVAEGGNLAIAVTASSDYAWTATSSASWLTITGGAAGKGNGQVTAKVAPTTVAATRWGTIKIGAVTALVVQAGLAGNVTITPTSASLPATGATGAIVVATNAPDYAWSFSVQASWIQSVYFSQLSTTGPGTLRYVVAANPDATARTGTILVGDKTFTITQAAGGPQVDEVAWTRLTLADAPMSRMGMDMAGVMVNGESILYGGNADATAFTDTWAWNGTAWTKKSPGHNPGTRTEHAMAYDANHDQIVLFGGFGASDSTDETWIWDSVDWKLTSPATKPPARANHAMTYNSLTKKVVMFGGHASDTNLYEWDGTVWTAKSSSAAPPASEGPTMAYDAARNEIVVFGGAKDLWSGAVPTFFSDTWIWNGTTWAIRKTAHSPSGRTGAKMAYDPQLGLVVLVGGHGAKGIGTTPPYNYTYDYREETWTWDGTDWTQQFPSHSPEFSYDYGMVYDPAHTQFVVHLGDDLHCADRGPRTYVLTPGTGWVAPR